MLTTCKSLWDDRVDCNGCESAESGSWGPDYNSWGHGRTHFNSELWRNLLEGLRRIQASEGHSYGVLSRGEMTVPCRVLGSIIGLSTRILFSNSDLRWVSDVQDLSNSSLESGSSGSWKHFLVPRCSHAQNEHHLISSPDINLHILMTGSRLMQEHAAKFIR